MATSGISAIPFRVSPINNIQPFTYREGMSHLQLLERLRVYINDTLRAEFNDNSDALFLAVEQGIANAEAVVLAAQDGWQARFDAYMLDVDASLRSLNDHAMAGLIDDPATETGSALINGFFQRTPTTNVWVDPVNGDDGNNGEQATPFKTIKRAYTLAELGAQNAATTWTINLVAGTYRERVTASKFTAFALNITIQGPEVDHPAVPVVLFTEGANVGAAAMKFENPLLNLTVKYVKFLGYNGTTSSAGINMAQGRVTTDNVHAEQCFYGVSCVHGEIAVPNGVFTNNGRTGAGTGNGAGIRSMMGSRHTIGIQGAGSRGATAVFTGNRYGFYAQETSTGHVDWCTFTDNESALVLRVSSRANMDGCSFARNLTDVAADSNSHAYIPDTVIFGTGADKSFQTVSLTSGSQATTTLDIDGADSAFSRDEFAVFANYDQQNVAGTTSTVFVMDKTLKKQWWNDNIRIGGSPAKRVRVRAKGTLNGSNGTAQFVLKMGDKTSSVTFSASETGPFTFEGEIIFASPTKQIISCEGTRSLGELTRSAISTTNQDMSVDQRLTLGVVLGSTADTVTVEYVELWQG